VLNWTVKKDTHVSRLPTPGSDDNQWGQILNDFLGQAHNADGSLKPGLVPVQSVNGQTGAVTLTASDVGAYTSGQITTLLRSTDAIINYNTGTSSYPLRDTVTSDTLRPVRWRGPIAPIINGVYAIDGLDVWEMTP
jgi:hypothetical protein